MNANKKLNIENQLTELESILERESRALTGPASTRLADIAMEKSRLLTELSQASHQPDKLAEFNKDVVSRIEKCRQRNEDNNLLVKQRLKVLRNTTRLLRSQTGRQSIELYDDDGYMVHSLHSNRLSEA